jgi:hypothetical protein
MEVGWHLRLSREVELVFLVQAKLAPNVEDAVFISGDWTLAWEPLPGAGDAQQGSAETPGLAARVLRKRPRGGAAEGGNHA